MDPVSLFKINYKIELSDVDFNKKLRVSGLFKLFQDIASMASDNLGFGIDTLKIKFGVAWVLMRIKVEVNKMPSLNEEILLETWPIEPSKIEFERDFLVRDSKGEIIARAVSTWAVIDLETRRLVKTERISIKYPEQILSRAIDGRMRKLKSSGQMETVYKRVVGYSDIDFNGHVNNSKYVDFIMDCFDIEKHNKYTVKSIEVHFINEILPGNTITLNVDLTSSASNIVYIEGINEKDGRTVFRAHLVIKER